MPLTVTSEVFASEYRKCFEDRSHDASALYGMVQPFISYWSTNLRERNPDIHMVSLLRLLSPCIDVAICDIEDWVEGVEETHSLEDELTEIFFECLRGMKYWPAQASAVMVEYVIALDFKRHLKDLIKSYKPLRNIPEEPEEYETVHPDYFLLSRLQVETWDRCLIEWLVNCYSIPAISRTTHIPEDTIRHDVRKLCQLAFSIDRLSSVRPATKAA